MAKVMNPVNFVLGQNSAMWLDKATTDEAKVKGLQGLGLAQGFSQTSTTVPMMGERISPKVFTGAEYDEMTVNANYIPGDKTQERLKSAALTGTMLKNIRLYIKDGCSFSAPDQPSTGGGLVSGTSGLNVGSYTDPSIAAPTDFYSNSISFAPGGTFAMFVAHTPQMAGASLTVTDDAGGKTIEYADGTWESLGFEEGDTVIVDWDGSTVEAPRYATVKSLSGSTMVLDPGVADVDLIKTGVLPSKAQVHGATSLSTSELDTAC